MWTFPNSVANGLFEPASTNAARCSNDINAQEADVGRFRGGLKQCTVTQLDGYLQLSQSGRSKAPKLSRSGSYLIKTAPYEFRLHPRKPSISVQ